MAPLDTVTPVNVLHHIAHQGLTAATQRADEEAGAGRIKARTRDCRKPVVVAHHPAERGHETLGADQHQLHVPTILGHEEVAGNRSDGQVADPHQRLAVAGAVPEDRVALVGQVHGVDPVVQRRGEEKGTVTHPGTATDRRHEAIGRLYPGGGDAARRVGYRNPRNATVGVHDHCLQWPIGQRRARCRPVEHREAVQATITVGLGQVAVATDRIHGDGPVGPYPQGVARHRRAFTGRVALPDPAVTLVGLLARQPGAPGGGGAATVGMAALQDRVGVEDRTPGVEPDGRSPAH